MHGKDRDKRKRPSSGFVKGTKDTSVLKELRSLRKEFCNLRLDFQEGVEHLHCLINQTMEGIMATKQEVLDAIAQEKSDIVAELQALKDQIGSGSVVTAADLDDIIASVKGMTGSDATA